MKVTNWKPILAGNPSCPVLYLTAVLECSFCHHVQDAKSGFAVIGGETTLEAAVEEMLDSIRSQRSCERCGIISFLPAADSKRFEREVKKTVTAIWLDETRKTLKPI